MKDFIDRRYPDLPDWNERSFNKLRIIAKEALDSITPENLANHVENMSRRCQAVIDADDGYTNFMDIEEILYYYP